MKRKTATSSAHSRTSGNPAADRGYSGFDAPSPPARARADAAPPRRARPDKPESGKPRARSVSERLAAEVDRLAAELAQAHARVAALEATAETDPLTEVCNRRGFARELKRSLAYVKRYGVSAALVYLDLDGFKAVNDRKGHAAGDAMLKAVAATLLRNVRGSDVVARIGGDEFAVLLWNLTGENAAAKAAALETAVYSTPVHWESSTLVVGAAAGVALLGARDTPAEVLARADAAMYLRKAAKRR
jgi:diguanylate cyclase (GGDEF)-like protein